MADFFWTFPYEIISTREEIPVQRLKGRVLFVIRAYGMTVLTTQRLHLISVTECQRQPLSFRQDESGLRYTMD